MKHVFLTAISACALALTACGGDSTSSDTTTNNSTSKGSNTGTKLCIDTITSSGISYKSADYDKDSDGCLNTDELNKLKQKIAADAAEIKARTVTALTTDIENTSSDYPKIELFSIIGSDAPVTESNVKHAVLDSSKHESKFTIKFKFNRNLDTDNSQSNAESLILGIGSDASAALSANTKIFPAHLILTAAVKDKGGITNKLTCTYNSAARKYNCGKDSVLESAVQIPGNANLFLLMCQGPEDNLTCSNHANIKLKLK